MKIDILKKAKEMGYKIAVSEKGFTRQRYKYRITKDKNILMYGNTLNEIAYLTEIKKYRIRHKKTKEDLCVNH